VKLSFLLPSNEPPFLAAKSALVSAFASVPVSFG